MTGQFTLFVICLYFPAKLVINESSQAFCKILFLHLCFIYFIYRGHWLLPGKEQQNISVEEVRSSTSFHLAYQEDAESWKKETGNTVKHCQIQFMLNLQEPFTFLILWFGMILRFTTVIQCLGKWPFVMKMYPSNETCCPQLLARPYAFNN